MSKSNNRYGKTMYRMFPTAILANPKPTPKLLKQWADLDRFAIHEFNKPYHALTGREQTDLMVNIKEGKYKNLADNKVRRPELGTQEVAKEVAGDAKSA